MRIGYARVSTNEQDPSMQISRLKDSGCSLVFDEKVSADCWNRPRLLQLINRLGPGDVLVVWKLDRLSRSLKDLLILMEKIQLVGAEVESLTETINIATAAGRMMMQMIGSFAEFERAILYERTIIGLEAARKEGRIGGRRPKLNLQQKKEILEVVGSGKKTAANIAKLFNVHPSTISRLCSKSKDRLVNS
ncbi:recombinase family protein [Candidatus Pantoea edessiphila]|uniref:Resolvase n=1 Tax=Candidatus Pantoea edessiphila TaxID=2044610 RepID=A0A2P5SV81_9GAMM|nr:recombinase family protein [Candidatus Pantoea edessiphila]PPI86255.1 resolvase [Candidatus Pantoea edessiphila]